MRTYGKVPRDKTGVKKVYRERSSTEWDVRIDCDDAYADEIINNLKQYDQVIDYCLVSGIELPDKLEYGPYNIQNCTGGSTHYGSQQQHVHIALVFKYPLRRDQVLAHVRGFMKKNR